MLKELFSIDITCIKILVWKMKFRLLKVYKKYVMTLDCVDEQKSTESV